ncbi:MFS transporter [Streptomyces sp. NPDC004539]|uniref:MFS transporter n=1 Tax=Streptomyces sp. NPDC004539 TaxID=3154280 RepID=UPI0033BE6DEF
MGQETASSTKVREKSGYRAALANKAIRRLLIGYIPFSLSSSMDKIAIVWIASELMPADKSLAISAVTILYLAPGVLVSLAFGTRLARVSPDRLTLVNSVNKCSFLTLSGILHILDLLSFSLFLVFLCLASLSGSFGRASWQSAIRNSAEGKHLFAANSLFSTVTQISFMAGPALGGILIAAMGAGPVLILDGLSYLSVLGAVLSVSRGKTPSAAAPAPPQDEAPPEPVEQPGARTRAWVLVSVTGVFYALYGPMVVQLPLKLIEDFRMSDTEAARSLGYAWSAVGVGSAITALLVGTRQSLARQGWASFVIFGWGAATVVVGLAPNFPVVIAGLFLGGLVFAPYTSIVQTILQATLSRRGFDTVNMYYSAVLNGAQPVGVAAAGALGVAYGPTPILVGTGILLIGTAATAAALTLRKGMSLDQRRAEH